MKEFLQHFIVLIQSYGITGLIALSFAESSFFPIPPDLLLIPMAFMNREMSIIYALITTAASVLGGIFGHKIGKSLGRPILNRFFSKEKVSKVEDYFSKYGGWAVGIAGFTPIPYKIFTISAGAFGVRTSVFVISSIVGRGARFFLEGFFIFFFGDIAKYYLTNYFELITIIITLICILSYIVWKALKKRKLVYGAGVVSYFKRKYYSIYNWIIKYRTFDTAAFYFFTNIALSIISLLLFSELVEDYFERGVWSFDVVVYRYLRSFSSKAVDTVFKIIAAAGNPKPIIALILIICLVLYYMNKKKDTVFFALSIVGVWVFNYILKAVIRRPGPDNLGLMQVSDYSFPSTYAMVFIAFAVLLIYFILLYSKNKKLACLAGFFILSFAVLIGISRIYLGVHYFSDVIAGWVAGILWASTSIIIHRILIYRKNLNESIK